MAHVQTVTRAADGPTLEANRRRKTVRAIWSTDEVDAHRTAFVQSGIDTSRFAANNVVLFEHGQSTERGRLPVANAIEYGPDRFKGKNVFIGTSRFWDDDEFAERLFSRYASQQLRGWSINVQPLEASPPTHEERRARGDWAEADVIYRSVRLLEVSCVSIPSNPSTLTLSVERRLGGVGGSATSRIALYRRWARDPILWGRLATELGRLEAEQRRSGVRLRGRKDIEGLSVEALRAEIERLKLMAELEELLGKHHQAMAHEAAAAERDKMLAEFAAGAGKRS